MDTPPDLIAPPVIAPTEPAFPTHGATFGVRFLARFIDLLYTLALGLITGFVAGMVLAILAHLGKTSPDWLGKLKEGNSFGVGILAMFVYVTIAEAIGGATLGKLICGLRTVSIDGRPCGFMAALKRDLAYHFDALFFGAVGYQAMKTSDLQQRYGDKWADTIVVKVREFTSTSPRAWWQLALGVAFGSSAWILIVGADLVFKALN